VGKYPHSHIPCLVQTENKIYPMPMVKYTAGSLMLWACFSAGSHIMTWHNFLSNTNR